MLSLRRQFTRRYSPLRSSSIRCLDAVCCCFGARLIRVSRRDLPINSSPDLGQLVLQEGTCRVRHQRKGVVQFDINESLDLSKLGFPEGTHWVRHQPKPPPE